MEYLRASLTLGINITFGGDRLDYSGDRATSTVDITTFKILINSTLSTEDAKMVMMMCPMHLVTVK
jgi:hypothetical protein